MWAMPGLVCLPACSDNLPRRKQKRLGQWRWYSLCYWDETKLPHSPLEFCRIPGYNVETDDERRMRTVPLPLETVALQDGLCTKPNREYCDAGFGSHNRSGNEVFSHRGGYCKHYEEEFCVQPVFRAWLFTAL